MTKKIAILTLHFANNYGAVLQVYALSKRLRDHGYEVEVLDYEMESARKNLIFSYPISFIRKVWLRGMLSPSKILSRLKGKPDCSNVFENKQSIFDEFRKKHLNISSVNHTAETLQKNCPDFDAFIVGSDQVWAADFLFTSPTYLLSFVPENKIKISYAASFGKRSLENYLKPTFSKFVKRIDHVSVREDSGLNIVKEFTNNVSQVLDPTLLLDDYSDIVSVNPESDYILVYKLNQEESLSNYFLNQVNNIACITGYKVIYISPDGSLDIDLADVRLPSPNELLGLIKNAKMILTNSFHGLVFSIIFNKPFLGFQRDLFEDKQNLRLTGLLSMFGIEDNLITFGTQINESNLESLLSIDYELVNKRIEKEKEKSWSFLKNAIEKK
ncbi:hypothetical protein BCU98_07195 [Vibrio splendidus]|uniref:polysaccharide pyruvyl transferase family protein n=1 Tax=Vibrio splendidus TaxID=29497 RepID=UPI000C859155|nr:polysaccharide pyruvyl transferase family protein [Vibrio splendidus]MBU2910344.1 polysaccharide pyruvyl transferase family protein [Vibrio splendidus]MDO6531108.1 polysaccharide pyruvyl transferase family protein [Vibrio splendidus]MDO6552042.1 polysaccharide pyruvyl transferase family protein [Vibrio splendidus]PMG09906.1 hypothetical protein BCU98_07195 [Vibrio splendidus]